ncbi:hypothetical protein M5D96_003664 [Drosophila gunungcola]|uniref:Uncharacterized protein n=1 Tax=Drosophila gunungcola TaxID=103775 RepID=A0A9Q0BRW5_9MUSC|nr:hypothetical protein M5D96_003664 [Drosophila gunungcola]
MTPRNADEADSSQTTTMSVQCSMHMGRCSISTWTPLHSVASPQRTIPNPNPNPNPNPETPNLKPQQTHPHQLRNMQLESNQTVPSRTRTRNQYDSAKSCPPACPSCSASANSAICHCTVSDDACASMETRVTELPAASQPL